MTPIVEASNGGVTIHLWLCARHQSDRRGDGWSVKPTGRDTVWGCDDCEATNLTLEFVKTREVSRLPTESECPRQGQPETWADRLKRLMRTEKAA